MGERLKKKVLVISLRDNVFFVRFCAQNLILEKTI